MRLGSGEAYSFPATYQPKRYPWSPPLSRSGRPGIYCCVAPSLQPCPDPAVGAPAEILPGFSGSGVWRREPAGLGDSVKSVTTHRPPAVFCRWLGSRRSGSPRGTRPPSPGRSPASRPCQLRLLT